MKPFVPIIIILMLFSASFVGMSYKAEKSSSIYKPNNPPYVPSNPIPHNGSTNVPPGGYLKWTGGDPDGDLVYYDVYFGPENPPEKVSSNQTETYFLLGFLNFNTTYYWKIVAWDKYGASTEGPIWSFTTDKSLSPYAPYDLKPEEGADIVPINVNLSWKGGDPNEWDKVYYSLFFEESNSNPELLDTIGPFNATQIEITYDLPFDLEIFKTYFWKVVATDIQYLTNGSGVYSFTTGINYPPGKPTIKGSHNVKVNKPYEYTVTAIDPDGDNVSYEIDWADGEISNWTTWYLSGEEVSMSHLYSEKAFCEIKVRAKDIYGAIGEWGEWRLVISKDKLIINLLFFQFLKSMFQFPLLQQLLERLML